MSDLSRYLAIIALATTILHTLPCYIIGEEFKFTPYIKKSLSMNLFFWLLYIYSFYNW